MPKIEQAYIDPDTGEVYFKDVNREWGLDGLEAGIELGLILGNNGGAGGGGLGGNPVDPSTIDPSLLNRTARLYGVLGAPVSIFTINNDGGPVTTDATVLPPPIAAVLVSSTTLRSLVGHPIMIYMVPQIVQLTYPASSAFTGRFMSNYPVNRTDFRMVRGIQNEINFYVRDVDRIAVSLGMSESLTITIVDPATDTLLMSRNLTNIDPSKGIYVLTVLPSEMDDWPTTPVSWSMSYNRADGSTVILWTDRQYSPYSTLTVTKAPVPGPVAPTVVNSFDTLSDNNLYSQTLRGSFLHGFSGGMQTLNLFMTGYTGDVRIDASLATSPVNDEFSMDWFQVDLQTYTAKTGNVVLNEVGNFLWMRVVVIPTSGTVDSFQYKA